MESGEFASKDQGVYQSSQDRTSRLEGGAKGQGLFFSGVTEKHLQYLWRSDIPKLLSNPYARHKKCSGCGSGQ